MSLSLAAKIAIASGTVLVIVTIIVLIYFLSAPAPAIVPIGAPVNTAPVVSTPPVYTAPTPVAPVYTPPVYVAPVVAAPRYVGCYTDTAMRALPTSTGGYTFTLATCRDAAKSIGAKIFGLQDGNATTGIGQCFTGATSTLADAQKYGSATNCVAMPGQNDIISNAHMGGVWSNAVYTF